MELAAANRAIDVDAIEESKPRTKQKKVDSAIVVDDEPEITELRKRAKESDSLLTALQNKLSAPLSEVDAFCSYIQSTLGSMTKRKFRQARLAIHDALRPFINQSSSEDELSSVSTLPEMTRHPPRKVLRSKASTSTADVW